MQVTVHTAKTQLSKLIEAAHAGEEVVIAKGTVPVARLEPLKPGAFQIGLLADQVPAGGPDFLEPLDEDDLAAWEGRA
jgi:prevent-host-death family protein